MTEGRKTELSVIGWREWVSLPDLGIRRIKVKADTGARSSALHAYDIREFNRHGETWVRFKVHPLQRSSRVSREAEAKVLEHRIIRSSNGKAERRPVIMSNVELLGICWPVELTLTNRDEMGFRMLLGRQAIRRRFLVDSGRSYYGEKPKRRVKSQSKSQKKDTK